MKLVKLGLRNNLKYIFVLPFGVNLRAGKVLLVSRSKVRGLLEYNLGLEEVGTTDQRPLRYGAYDILPEDFDGKLPREVELKPELIVEDRSMTIRPKVKTKKVKK